VELKEYLLPLRRWWWLIVAATLVATVSSYLATRQQSPIYQARVTLMVGSAIQNPNPSGSDFWLTQQLTTTYVELAQRDAIREAVKAALGLSWLPAYTAKTVPNTQLIEITVTDTSPERCQVIANEIGNQLVRISPTNPDKAGQQRQEFINQQLAELEVKIKETSEEINKKQAELADMFSARQIADTQTQIAGLQNKLAALQSNYAALLANTEKGAINTITVVEPARLPTEPVGPDKVATILLAAAIGLGLAVAAAYLLEYLDDTFKTPEMAQRTLNLTILGAVPTMELEEGQPEVEVAARPKSGATEAYRVLRTNIQFAEVSQPARSILITSPSPTEGKSLTVANLGAAMAQAGQRVILIDTDLRRPRLHRLFGLRNTIGVTTALIEERPALDDLLQDTGAPNLQVLCSGPLPPNPSELLSSVRLRSLLGMLKERADVLLLDSPPATILSDAVILATQSEAVLLVIDVLKTRRDAAKRAVDALRQVNARILGLVMNRVPARGRGYYYYHYYYYYYSHGYGSEQGSRRKGKHRQRQPAPDEQPSTTT
jgi:succinoglycan biosynthesis transport protein ExoP